jgi:hypothetical protein
MAMALPRLGNCLSENRAIAGFDFCCFSCSVFFKGLLGGNGTRTALFAAAAPASATDKAVTTATLLYMPFALEAERLVPIVKGHMIRSAINRRQFPGVSAGIRLALKSTRPTLIPTSRAPSVLLGIDVAQMLTNRPAV